MTSMPPYLALATPPSQKMRKKFVGYPEAACQSTSICRYTSTDAAVKV